jgi:hypothetical protein
MSELTTKIPFAAGEYVDPATTDGINGGNEFEPSEKLFAGDVNKIVKNQMYLKENKVSKQDIKTLNNQSLVGNGNYSISDLGGAPADHSHSVSQIINFPTSMPPNAHSHEEYAVNWHGHDYAPSSHGHDYAPSSHGHDYASTSHTHNYAPAGHSHTGNISVITVEDFSGSTLKIKSSNITVS